MLRERSEPSVQLPVGATPPTRLGRALGVGAVGIALPILVHALLLPVFGAGSTPLFSVFFVSLLPSTATAFLCAGQSMLRIGYAMVIVIGAAFLSLSLHEARIFGTVPSLDASAAPAHPAAAGFLLPSAVPRVDLAREVTASVTLPRRDMRGRPTTPTTLRGGFTLVPVVDARWTPAQPVDVLAVLDHGPDGVVRAVRTARWDSGRGVLRLLPDPLRDHAVRQAPTDGAWTVAPNAVVGRWVEDPRWARLDAARPLLSLFAFALLGLGLVILSRHPWIATRIDPVMAGPTRPGASPPLGREILQGVVALTLPSLLALGLRHAQVDVGVMMLAICFAAVPPLMLTIGGSGEATPIGSIIFRVILVVTLPLAVAARGTTPAGELPSLVGARWADVREAMLVLGVGWLVWAAVAMVGRAWEAYARFAARR